MHTMAIAFKVAAENPDASDSELAAMVRAAVQRFDGEMVRRQQARDRARAYHAMVRAAA